MPHCCDDVSRMLHLWQFSGYLMLLRRAQLPSKHPAFLLGPMCTLVLFRLSALYFQFSGPLHIVFRLSCKTCVPRPSLSLRPSTSGSTWLVFFPAYYSNVAFVSLLAFLYLFVSVCCEPRKCSVSLLRPVWSSCC